MNEPSLSAVKLVSEIGYMASLKGAPVSGEKIMEGIHAIKPSQVPVKIGLAVAKMANGKSQESISILRDSVLAVEPDNMTAMTFLAVAYQDAGDAQESQKLFEHVQQHGDQEQQLIASVFLN